MEPKDRREIINTITNIARVADVKIISLKPDEKRKVIKSDIYDKVFFDIIIETDSYHKIGEFISQLENNPVIFIAESLNLEKGVASRVSKTQDTDITFDKLEARLIISELFFKE